MEIIHLLTDINPIQVIVDAVVNSGPREDVTRMGSADVVRREAVDISLLRRVYQAIYVLTTGARGSSFRKVKTIAECLTMYTRDLPTVMPFRRVGLSVLPRLTDKDICFGQQFRCKLLGILYMFG